MKQQTCTKKRWEQITNSGQFQRKRIICERFERAPYLCQFNESNNV